MAEIAIRKLRATGVLGNSGSAPRDEINIVSL